MKNKVSGINFPLSLAGCAVWGFFGRSRKYPAWRGRECFGALWFMGNQTQDSVQGNQPGWKPGSEAKELLWNREDISLKAFRCWRLASRGRPPLRPHLFSAVFSNNENNSVSSVYHSLSRHHLRLSESSIPSPPFRWRNLKFRNATFSAQGQALSGRGSVPAGAATKARVL